MVKRKTNKKITDSARGKNCEVRIPGACNFNEETTIPAHLNGGGMGTKHDDIFISYCCSSCHLVLDGQVKSAFSQTELKLMHHEGVVRTQYLLLEQGLIKA